MRRREGFADESGSSPVEFVLVGTLLTVLTLAVLQLGLGVYVRNVVHDAAVDGAHRAALADATLEEGEERARQAIVQAVGGAYDDDVSARFSEELGHSTVEVTVRTTLPIIGLLGVPFGMEVHAHAPVETLGER